VSRSSSSGLTLSERRLRRKASMGNGTLVFPHSEGGLKRHLSSSGLSVNLGTSTSSNEDLTKFRLFWLKLLDIMKEQPTSSEDSQKSQNNKEHIPIELQRYQEIEALVKEYHQKFNVAAIEKGQTRFLSLLFFLSLFFTSYFTTHSHFDKRINA
jgi:hypothetical protein